MLHNVANATPGLCKPQNWNSVFDLKKLTIHPQCTPERKILMGTIRNVHQSLLSFQSNSRIHCVKTHRLVVWISSKPKKTVTLNALSAPWIKFCYRNVFLHVTTTKCCLSTWQTASLGVAQLHPVTICHTLHLASFVWHNRHLAAWQPSLYTVRQKNVRYPPKKCESDASLCP